MSRGTGWLLPFLVLTGCPGGEAPVLLPDFRVLRWMQCQECRAGELDAVVALGQAAVPDLRRMLLEGPPSQFVARVDSALQASPLPGAPQAADTTVQTVLEDYRSNFRVRAARALGTIGGSDARAALCAGRDTSFARAEVKAAILAALNQAGGTCP